MDSNWILMYYKGSACGAPTPTRGILAGPFSNPNRYNRGLNPQTERGEWRAAKWRLHRIQSPNGTRKRRTWTPTLSLLRSPPSSASWGSPATRPLEASWAPSSVMVSFTPSFALLVWPSCSSTGFPALMSLLLGWCTRFLFDSWTTFTSRKWRYETPPPVVGRLSFGWGFKSLMPWFEGDSKFRPKGGLLDVQPPSWLGGGSFGLAFDLHYH